MRWITSRSASVVRGIVFAIFCYLRAGGAIDIREERGSEPALRKRGGVLVVPEVASFIAQRLDRIETRRAPRRVPFVR
jgi:hypothetical protein